MAKALKGVTVDEFTHFEEWELRLEGSAGEETEV